MTSSQLLAVAAATLNELVITFFHQQIFHTPRLAQFISRTLNIRAHGEARAARISFSSWSVSITLPSTTFKGLRLSISYKESDEQLSLLSVVQAWSSSFPQTFIPAVEHLYIVEDDSSLLYWDDDIENSQWLELLHLFIAVKDLYLSSKITPRIVPALQELVGERETEVLPALQTLFLEETLPSESEPVQESIGQYVAAQQVSSHPITVSRWKWDFMRLNLSNFDD